MHGRQVLVGRRLRPNEREACEKPQRLAQLHRQPHAQRVERVLPPEPVLLQRQVVDEDRPPAHDACPVPSSGAGGHSTSYPVPRRRSTAPRVFMVPSRSTTTRRAAPSEPRTTSGEASTLTRFTPASRSTSTTPASAPGRSGRATSTRLPGSCAPTSRTNAFMTSEAVSMPTSSSPPITGRHPILFPYIAIAACSIGSSGCAVTTCRAISSPTVMLSSAAVRSGSPKAGVAERRSRSEMRPTRRPPSTTGRCRILRSRHSASASAAVAPGATVTTSRVMESLTSSMSSSPIPYTQPLAAVYEAPAARARICPPRTGWYKDLVTEPLNQLLADSAYALVHESFTSVAANWWWERRMGGG